MRPSRVSGSDGKHDPSLSYEDARDLARHPDAAVRGRLASRPDVRPEVLYYLAADPVPDVRIEIAQNLATPPQANLILARDGDERVRCELAAKIGRLMPHLPAEVHNKLRDITIQVLEILARDELSRVRQIIADTLKEVVNAPPHVIRWLAHDIDPAVATPVLQFSPLITDNDLVELIESTPVRGVLAAIARRHGLSAAVCDAIVTTDDAEAIADLLGNSSAQVTEDTLDYTVERAREVTEWQEPLVKRPRLPVMTLRKLAGFVADSLLSVLTQRGDLPREAFLEVSQIVRQRLAAAGKSDAVSTAAHAATPVAANDGGAEPIGIERDASPAKLARLSRHVQQLYAKGALGEEQIAEALDKGEVDFARLAIAFKAGLPPTLVARVIASRSGQGMAALAWKAGLSVSFAVSLQERLAHVPTAEIVRSSDGETYPMAAAEMMRLIDAFSGQGF